MKSYVIFLASLLAVCSLSAMENPNSHTILNEVFAAIDAGSLKKVQTLVSTHHCVNWTQRKSCWGKSHDIAPLAYAMNLEKWEIATALVNAGADINRSGYWGYTPLEIAATNNNKELVKLLLDKGANSTIDQALHAVCKRGYVEIIKLLLDNGANINAQSDGGRTPLMATIQYCSIHAGAFRLLLEKGADIQIKNDYGRTVLSYFDVSLFDKFAGDTAQACVKTLINHGARIVESWGYNQAVFIDEVYAKDKKYAQELVEGALKWALENKNKERLQELYNHNLQIIKEVVNDMLSHLVATKPQSQTCLEHIELLLQAGVDPDVKNKDGKVITPRLSIAMKDEPMDETLIKLLVEYGADIEEPFSVEKKDINGFSKAVNRPETLLRLLLDIAYAKPLMHSIKHNDVSYLKKLLESGRFSANAKYQDKPLLQLVVEQIRSDDVLKNPKLEQTYAQMIDLLCDYGADLDAKNDAGQTPLDVLDEYMQELREKADGGSSLYEARLSKRAKLG